MKRNERKIQIHQEENGCAHQIIQQMGVTAEAYLPKFS